MVSNATPPSHPKPPTPEELRRAFDLFSVTSARLADTYLELQAEVARLSAELAAANGELARRERLSALGEMAAKLAHQLRTPLAAAMLYVSHLARPQLEEHDRLRFASKAMARLHYLEHLITDMLAFVKGAQGERSRFRIRDMLHDVVQVTEPQFAAHAVRLLLDDQVGELDIEGNRPALSGALTSLLENALQASRPGQCVRLSAHANAGPFVVLQVADEGEGIAPEVRERLFEPFFTTRPDGSGLGLAIVKQTADAHGGWVEVESTPGAGSTFVLYIPQRMGEEEGR